VSDAIAKVKAIIGPTNIPDTEPLAQAALDKLHNGEIPSAEEITALEIVVRLLRPVVYTRNGKLDDYFAINGEIHNTIVRMARNAPLREAHETLISRAERARYLALGANSRWSNSVDEHADILAALEAHDSEAAGRLLGAHVRRTGTALLEVIATSQAKQTAA